MEFMNAVMGIHNHYHSLIADLFSSHKLFYSVLDKVWPYSQTDRDSEVFNLHLKGGVVLCVERLSNARHQI